MYDETRVVIKDRREMLRVKVKSLCNEAHIISREERRTRGELREELRAHRSDTLRFEARASYLAYGLVKGRTVQQIECKVNDCNRRTEALWDRVRAMVKRYGPVNPLLNAQLLEQCKG